MAVSGVLKALALFFLAQDPRDSRVSCAPTLEQLISTRTPHSMKHMLNFVGSLRLSGVKDQVLSKIESKVKDYFDGDAAPGESIRSNFDAALERIDKLRDILLWYPANYGVYADLQTTPAFIDKYANVLIDWLPVFSTELTFLFFHVAADCHRISGGRWSSLRFGHAYSNSELHLWLTDRMSGAPAIGLIKRGFEKEELLDRGRAVELDAALSVDFFEGCPFSYTQYGLFLLSSNWHNSNLASALLFLDVFCQDYMGGKFKYKVFGAPNEQMLPICDSLSLNVVLLSSYLWPLYNPRMTDHGESLVGSLALYKDALKADMFDHYVDWLIQNIPPVKDSIIQMHQESADWYWSEMYNCKTSGPFKYGFVFKDRHWYGSLYYSILVPIKAMTEGPTSLQSLRAHLEYYKKYAEEYREALLLTAASE